jgi:hypothetical protein
MARHCLADSYFREDGGGVRTHMVRTSDHCYVRELKTDLPRATMGAKATAKPARRSSRTARTQIVRRNVPVKQRYVVSIDPIKPAPVADGTEPTFKNLCRQERRDFYVLHNVWTRDGAHSQPYREHRVLKLGAACVEPTLSPMQRTRRDQWNAAHEEIKDSKIIPRPEREEEILAAKRHQKLVDTDEIEAGVLDKVRRLWELSKAAPNLSTNYLKGKNDQQHESSEDGERPPRPLVECRMNTRPGVFSKLDPERPEIIRLLDTVTFKRAGHGLVPDGGDIERGPPLAATTGLPAEIAALCPTRPIARLGGLVFATDYAPENSARCLGAMIGRNASATYRGLPLVDEFGKPLGSYRGKEKIAADLKERADSNAHYARLLDTNPARFIETNKAIKEKHAPNKLNHKKRMAGLKSQRCRSNPIAPPPLDLPCPILTGPAALPCGSLDVRESFLCGKTSARRRSSNDGREDCGDFGNDREADLVPRAGDVVDDADDVVEFFTTAGLTDDDGADNDGDVSDTSEPQDDLARIQRYLTAAESQIFDLARTAKWTEIATALGYVGARPDQHGKRLFIDAANKLSKLDF